MNIIHLIVMTGKFNYNVLIIRLLFLIAPVYAFADSSIDPSVLYADGKYQEAVSKYLEIEKSQGTSSSLCFDIANSYAQMGDLGHAMLYYSRAHRMNPGNKEIKNNLNFFTSKVEDSNRAELKGKKISVSPDHETFFTTADRIIARDVLSDTWAIWSALAFVLFIGCVAIYLFCGNVILRKTGFFGGLLLLVLSVIFIVFAFWAESNQNSKDSCVLMSYKTELLVEPSSDAKPATTQLCQGTCLEIVAQETDVQGSANWYKVRLNSNFEGWIRSSDVEII